MSQSWKVWADEVLQIEAQAVQGLRSCIDEAFVQAVEAILASQGKLIVSGMGKSGIIGHKIAATLASTGTPSVFMHPGEAFHGDLGLVTPNDTVLLISNSGETSEVLQLIPFFKDNRNKLIGFSSNPQSTLAQHVDFHICVKVHKEACPLDLAPTSSTTATLAMGDALAVVLMKARNFQSENFARFHPGGNLGRRLLSKVSHIMRKDNLPLIAPHADGLEIIAAISKGRLGLAIVVEQGEVQGIITDGDLRRSMERLREQFFATQAMHIMTPKPVAISQWASLQEAEERMMAKKITSLLVEDDNGHLCGVVQIYDM